METHRDGDIPRRGRIKTGTYKDVDTGTRTDGDTGTHRDGDIQRRGHVETGTYKDRDT